MNKTPTPFQCRYTPQVPELLSKLQVSLALTTYQAGKTIFLSPGSEDKIVQLPRNFEKPMGIAISKDQNRLAIAGKYSITVFKKSHALAQGYPAKPNTYDSIFLPRINYITGYLDLHDIEFAKNQVGLYAVSSLFSCIAYIDGKGDYSFTPYWKPSFITELMPEDRCHLNGMAFKDGKPKYVTAFNTGNTAQSWRENITESGVLIDVETNQVICQGLKMPHSPTWINGELYILQSASGELIHIDLNSGKTETILEFGSFVRGMDAMGEYLFVATSKLRKNSSTFAHLPISDLSDHCGILIYHIPSRSLVGKIQYDMSVDEVYDVTILQGVKRPNILNTHKQEHSLAIELPNTSFWAQPKEKETIN